MSIVGDATGANTPLRLWYEIYRNAKWQAPGTRKDKMCAVYCALKHDPSLGSDATRAFWRARKEEARRACNLHDANNVQTPEASIRTPDLTRLRAAEKSMAERARVGDRGDSQEHLWLAVAAYVPAKRRDWGSVLIVYSASEGIRQDDAKKNHLILTDTGARVVFNVYKEAKTYGRFAEDLPVNVTSALRASISRFPRTYMFENRDGEPFSGGKSFGDWAIATLRKHHGGDPITLNGLRKAWSQTVADGRIATNAERGRLAKSMMHSVQVQQAYYIKTSAE